MSDNTSQNTARPSPMGDTLADMACLPFLLNGTTPSVPPVKRDANETHMMCALWALARHAYQPSREGPISHKRKSSREILANWRHFMGSSKEDAPTNFQTQSLGASWAAVAVSNRNAHNIKIAQGVRWEVKAKRRASLPLNANHGGGARKNELARHPEHRRHEQCRFSWGHANAPHRRYCQCACHATRTGAVWTTKPHYRLQPKSADKQCQSKALSS